MQQHSLTQRIARGAVLSVAGLVAFSAVTAMQGGSVALPVPSLEAAFGGACVAGAAELFRRVLRKLDAVDKTCNELSGQMQLVQQTLNGSDGRGGLVSAVRQLLGEPIV